MIDSIWQEGLYGILRHPRLRGEITADVAVIGGGMAGILCADALRRAGVSVVVLERDRVGSGQTGGTSAKITAQHGTVYHNLQKRSAELAEGYAAANQWAVRAFVERIRKDSIACDLEERDAYVYALRDKELLEREYRAQRASGLAVKYTHVDALPFETVGAIQLAHQAQIHPLKLLYAISANLRIFEGSGVTQVCGTDVLTAHGCVHAKRVVFACHYPFVNFPGLFFARMHQERESFLALRHAPIPEGMWVCAEEDGFSLRTVAGLTLFGGLPHRTGTRRHANSYTLLRRRAQELLGSRSVAAQWSAQDCIPASGKPYIGRFCRTRPDWFVATGFGKWGMTSSMVASRIICDLICERKNEWEGVFSPLSHSIVSVKGIAIETAHAAKGLAKAAFALPRECVDSLAPGHGEVVFFNGKRVGVYKDSEGRIYTVRATCPHLGCRLEWNADDLSWDCPCHGSRFDYKGNLLNGPAQKGIHR